MIFGVYGAHCTGKTTFVRSVGLAEIRKAYGDLTAANFDNIPEFPKQEYYRDADYKQKFIDYMMSQRDVLWLVEGCRFWGGMMRRLAGLMDKHDGGAFILTVTTLPDLMMELLINRSVRNNRTLKREYWTDSRLRYEAIDRHLNACSKNLHPGDWTHIGFTGDYSMWDGIPLELLTIFHRDRTLWYY